MDEEGKAMHIMDYKDDDSIVGKTADTDLMHSALKYELAEEIDEAAIEFNEA